VKVHLQDARPLTCQALVARDAKGPFPARVEHAAKVSVSKLLDSARQRYTFQAPDEHAAKVGTAIPTGRIAQVTTNPYKSNANQCSTHAARRLDVLHLNQRFLNTAAIIASGSVAPGRSRFIAKQRSNRTTRCLGVTSASIAAGHNGFTSKHSSIRTTHSLDVLHNPPQWLAVLRGPQLHLDSAAITATTRLAQIKTDPSPNSVALPDCRHSTPASTTTGSIAPGRDTASSQKGNDLPPGARSSVYSLLKAKGHRLQAAGLRDAL
jgi:hypothetical protein